MNIRKVGRVLVVLGVAVWGIFAIAWLFDLEPTVRVYLPFHLAGVIPGAILFRWPVSDPNAQSSIAD